MITNGAAVAARGALNSAWAPGHLLTGRAGPLSHGCGAASLRPLCAIAAMPRRSGSSQFLLLGFEWFPLPRLRRLGRTSGEAATLASPEEHDRGSEAEQSDRSEGRRMGTDQKSEEAEQDRH